MNNLPETAMVMAAGLGLRMRPLSDLPKPMIPVAGISLIDRTLDWLAASGVKRAVVNTHYRAEIIKEHLSQRKKPAITISHEKELLETGGGIVKAMPLLGNTPFFSVNSDVICLDGAKPALARLAAQWSESLDALLLLQTVDKAVGYDGLGDFFMDEKGLLTWRGDKPSAPYVFTGVQLLHPRLFRNAPTGKFSLTLLYDRALTTPHTSKIAGIVHDGAWLHVGSPDGVHQAEAFLQKHAR